jgi:hypothetical protein
MVTPNSMHLTAEPESEDGAEILKSLYRWLLQDGDITAASVNLVQREGEAGAMSGALETILAVTDQVGTYGSLILSYLTWRSTKRGDAATGLCVTLERGGEKIRIENLTDAQVMRLVERAGASEGESA